MGESFKRNWVRALKVLGLVAFFRWGWSKLRSGDTGRPGRSVLARLFQRTAQAVDQSVGWHRLPRPLGVLVLIGLRTTLRERNLYDTSAIPAAEQPPPSTERERVQDLYRRVADGTHNDPESPLMGCAHTRFGRNVPLSRAFPESDADILSPSPRLVSRELLTRRSFQPATTLNLLAAAWIQFMVHDWFSHGKNEKEAPWQVPLEAGDPWHENPMRILRTRRDPTRADTSGEFPPTFINTETHWWDASQIYGSDAATLSRVRSGQDGKLIISGDGLLPVDPQTGVDITGINGNWWIGLSLLHTLFTLEHNAICDRLRTEYPSWSDADLFDHARLITAALLAKIHTVEWTPAILNHPVLRIAMNANWWGLASERLHKLVGRISESEVISGIPGSKRDHHGVPYAMTEEFVAVYRMHSLLPDEFSFRSLDNDSVLKECTFPEVADRNARSLLGQVSVTDCLYTFGTSHPGAITLHNFPRFLQRRTEPDGTVIDLAATDVLRDRERGVPRYNAFRRLVHLRPVDSFEALTDNPVCVEELRRVYENRIERVDLLVGLHAERRPEGFGFSDTAFRIFILMASRRLKSDRFFTTDYTPNVYTQCGLEWINTNSMASVLLRHFPRLLSSVGNARNAFAPWERAGNRP